MKRKVYVMDCGDFVKIGVSGNVEQRATQIPYKVNRIYSTDEMEDAFKLEREMHKQSEPSLTCFDCRGISTDGLRAKGTGKFKSWVMITTPFLCQ